MCGHTLLSYLVSFRAALSVKKMCTAYNILDACANTHEN